MSPHVTPPFYISEADALQLMRAALSRHGNLLPPWQKPDEKTAEFGTWMLVFGSPENLLFCLGRDFAHALVPFLEKAQAYELAAGMREAIRLGRCLTDDEGLPGVHLNYMNTDIQGEAYPTKTPPKETRGKTPDSELDFAPVA